MRLHVGSPHRILQPIVQLYPHNSILTQTKHPFGHVSTCLGTPTAGRTPTHVKQICSSFHTSSQRKQDRSSTTFKHVVTVHQPALVFVSSGHRPQRVRQRYGSPLSFPRVVAFALALYKLRNFSLSTASFDSRQLATQAACMKLCLALLCRLPARREATASCYTAADVTRNLHDKLA